jgi:peptidoglycan/LPS O-acetylase OafA/YrhL
MATAETASDRTPARPKERIFGLDVMRAAAVLLVVFGHFLDHGRQLSPWIYDLKRPGVFGVEIFFVLSGYLIGGIIIAAIKARRFDRFSDLGRFWIRRWLRTLPLYYLFFALYLRWEWTGPQRFGERVEYLAFLQNFAWTIPNFFIISWSLAVEEFFYLLFPFFLWLVLKRHPPRRALAISIGVFMIVPLALRALTAPYPGWDAFDFHLRMMVVKRLDAPMFGVAAVFIKEFFPEKWRAMARWTPLSAACLLGAGVHIYFFDNRFLWAPPWNVLQIFYFPVMATLVALQLPALSQWSRKTSLATAGITFISTISYSIYLVHPLVIHWVREFFEREPGRMERMDAQFVWLTLANLALIALFSSLSYYGWERPFMRLRDRRWIEKP